MSYQECIRFRTAVDFDRERIKQSTRGKERYELRFFPRLAENNTVVAIAVSNNCRAP